MPFLGAGETLHFEGSCGSLPVLHNVGLDLLKLDRTYSFKHGSVLIAKFQNKMSPNQIY